MELVKRYRSIKWLVAFCLITCCCARIPAGAQSERKIAVLCHSGEYRCGEGMGETPDAAKDAALHSLVTSISALITSSQSYEVTENSDSLASEYRSSSQVLSVRQLDGLEYRHLSKSDGRYRAIAMVKEEALQAGMARQRDRVRSMVDEALQAASDARIDDALRLTYWAYLLSHTVDTLNVEWPGVQLSEPRQVLLEGIGQLVAGVDFVVAAAVLEKESIGIPLRATYGMRPAALDFSLYTGVGMDFPRIANGRGYIELHRNPEDVFTEEVLILQLLYAYEGKMRQFPEIEALHQIFGKAKLNTDVNIRVHFPFAKSPSVASPPPVPNSLPVEAIAQVEFPLPIRVLSEQTETSALLEALQAYASNHRLVYFTQQPDTKTEKVYIAIVTQEHVLGVYKLDGAGYLDVRRQKRYESLKRREFDGAYRIWIVAK